MTLTENSYLPKCDTTVSNVNTDVSKEHATYILTEDPEDGCEIATKRQYLSFPVHGITWGNINISST